MTEFKRDILNVANLLEKGEIDEVTAKKYLLELLNDWKLVSEEYPPDDIEVLAQSPEGVKYLVHWRPGYNIFTCQTKRKG